MSNITSCATFNQRQVAPIELEAFHIWDSWTHKLYASRFSDTISPPTSILSAHAFFGHESVGSVAHSRFQWADARDLHICGAETLVEQPYCGAVGFGAACPRSRSAWFAAPGRWSLYPQRRAYPRGHQSAGSRSGRCHDTWIMNSSLVNITKPPWLMSWWGDWSRPSLLIQRYVHKKKLHMTYIFIYQANCAWCELV